MVGDRRTYVAVLIMEWSVGDMHRPWPCTQVVAVSTRMGHCLLKKMGC